MSSRNPKATTAGAGLQGAVSLHRQGRLDEAEAAYRALLQDTPADPVANHNLGDLLLRKSGAEPALPHFLAALEADPAHGQYWISYVDALLQAGRTGEAGEALDLGCRHGLQGDDVDGLARRLAAAVEGGGGAAHAQPPQDDVKAMLRRFDAGAFPEVEAWARAVIRQHPEQVVGWKALGAALKAMGRREEALQAMQRAVALDPMDAEALNNLGAAHHDLGQLQEAEAQYRRALEISPKLADAHFNRGVTLAALRCPDQAVSSFLAALAIRPEHAEAWNALGIAFKELGSPDEAEAAFRSALRIAPGFAPALGNLGVVLHQIGRLAAAEDCYRRLLELDPDQAAVHSNLAAILHNLGRTEEAEARYRQAITLAPQLAEAHHDLGNTLKSLGRLDEAAACYREAGRLGFNDSQVKAALMLPAIMGTGDEVRESRDRFERNLDRLIAERVAIDDPLRNIGETSFYLAYHGLNDRDLQIKLARFYGQACPSLLHVAPHCAPQAARRPGGIRVGFLSKFLYRHSVSMCFSRIITSLSAHRGFEVSLISSEAVDAGLYPGYAGRTVRIEHELARARTAIERLELDILVYLDIGMEPLGYFLAFSRLAREQCVLAGHPVTTGIATIDHFVSVASMEPDDAERHYSERLLRLPRPLAYFERPAAPERLLAREELGLPPDRRLYLCPMKLQKMHPDFDYAISEILGSDAMALIVLFEDDVHAYWKEALTARLERTVAAGRRSRILFLPWLKDPDAFFSAIAAADVVLDPFHFGLGTTSAVIAAAGTPLVTLEGEFMRGRVGAHYCRMLEVEECIAHDAGEYVRIAVGIASDPARRQRLVQAVRRNCAFLFQGFDASEIFADMLFSLARGEPSAMAST